MNSRARHALLAAFCLSLAACSNINISLWPFGEEKLQERSRTPANATGYQCTPAKRFYVRRLDDGAVWLILQDRELRLNKTGEARYANGAMVLELSGNEATLSDGPATLKDCKATQGS